MNTFTEVNGNKYYGLLIREMRLNAHRMWLFYSYLSAALPNNKWVSVEKWDENEQSACSEDDLRKVLSVEIRKKISK